MKRACSVNSRSRRSERSVFAVLKRQAVMNTWTVVDEGSGDENRGSPVVFVEPVNEIEAQKHSQEVATTA